MIYILCMIKISISAKNWTGNRAFLRYHSHYSLNSLEWQRTVIMQRDPVHYPYHILKGHIVNCPNIMQVSEFHLDHLSSCIRSFFTLAAFFYYLCKTMDTRRLPHLSSFFSGEAKQKMIFFHIMLSTTRMLVL